MSEGEAIGFGFVTIVLLSIAGLIVSLLPTMIAFGRDHSHKWAIFAVNVFGGIISFGLGWFVALVWALLPDSRKGTPTSVNVTVTQKQNLPVARFCPHCGARVSGSTFCAKCGGKL